MLSIATPGAVHNQVGNRALRCDGRRATTLCGSAVFTPGSEEEGGEVFYKKNYPTKKNRSRTLAQYSGKTQIYPTGKKAGVWWKAGIFYLAPHPRKKSKEKSRNRKRTYRSTTECIQDALCNGGKTDETYFKTGVPLTTRVWETVDIGYWTLDM